MLLCLFHCKYIYIRILLHLLLHFFYSCVGSKLSVVVDFWYIQKYYFRLMLLRWFVPFCLFALVLCDEPKKEAPEEENDVEVEYEMDEGVVILTDKNFDDYMKKNPTVMVKFYAPW